jgi:hypothetical protein
LACAAARAVHSRSQLIEEALGSIGRAHQRTDGTDHREDAVDAALVEGMELDAVTNQLGGDVSRQAGEGQRQMRAAARRP